MESDVLNRELQDPCRPQHETEVGLNLKLVLRFKVIRKGSSKSMAGKSQIRSCTS